MSNPEIRSVRRHRPRPGQCVGGPLPLRSIPLITAGLASANPWVLGNRDVWTNRACELDVPPFFPAIPCCRRALHCAQREP